MENVLQKKSAIITLKKAWTVPVFGLVFALLTVGLLLIVADQEYSSETQLLVVQKYTLTDSYTASKSAEKISRNLAEVVHTSTFFDEVVASKEVDLSDILLLSEKKKRKKWSETVETEIVSRTSMLRIRAYDADPARAEAIVSAVTDTLLKNSGEYHGAADTVELRIVDTALTSDRPTRPNFIVNGIAAALLGAILGFLVFLLRPSVPFGVKKKATHVVPTPPVDVVDPSEETVYNVLEVDNFHKTLPQHNSDTK